MSVIYGTNDRIRVKIGGLVFSISPLTFKTKSDMQALVMKGDAMGAAALAVKHAVKSIDGVKRPDGSVYELEFEDGVLSDNAIDDLLNIPQGTKLSQIAVELINGMPKEFVDATTGTKMEGVEIVKESKSRKK